MPDLDIAAASADIGASLAASFGSSDSSDVTSGESAPADFGRTAGVDPEPDASSAPQTPGETSVEGKGDSQAPSGDSPAPSGTEAVAPATPFPSSWNKSLEAEWANLSPSVQAEVARREADILKGIEQYKGEASYAKAVKSIFEPYSQVIAQQNIDPLDMTAKLINAHYQLSYSQPEQKRALFTQLAQSYGIDLAEGAEELPYIDPVTRQLQEEVAALKHSRQQEQLATQSRQTSAIQQEIAEFRSNPANEHFEKLENIMARLITAGQATTLQDAYDQAIYLDPEVRAQVLARQQTEAAEKAKQEQIKKVEEAKKAMSVNAGAGSVNSRAAHPSSGNLEDTLNETLRSIRARS